MYNKSDETRESKLFQKNQFFCAGKFICLQPVKIYAARKVNLAG